jgi:hypothetical protein
MCIQRLFILITVFFTTCLQAQITLPVPENIQAAYDKGTRSATGQPGINYWQNTANYIISVQYHPETRLVSGTVVIDYFNKSPDTLTQIVFKLYPNLYKNGSARLTPVAPQDISDGVRISSFQANNDMIDTAKLEVNGTNMVAPVMLLPRQNMRFRINYSYVLNKTSHLRTGMVDSGSAFIAYFFPRITVYDDIDGWNMHPYLGPQEFYNDFCNFNVSITVPANYLVWATGDLNNCSEVLNDKYCRRLQLAEQQNEVVDIVTAQDLQEKMITRQNATNTWRFTANRVTDFAFAVSDHYIWKSNSVEVNPTLQRRTRVDAVFNPAHKDYYEVVDFAAKTVWAMSYVFPKWPFPYSHMTVFDGLDQMEYPMMANDNPLPSRAETIELTDHEIFHTMFPFYMGINETKYGWMDEGWATLGEWLISPIIDSTIVDEYGMDRYEKSAGTEADLPVVTLTTQLNGLSMFTSTYPKPALGYLYVKDMLGDSLFTRALHFYIQSWQGKHPMPYDFFNCMNVGAGMNLNWFWKKWFFDSGAPDLSIKKVTRVPKGYAVVVENKGGKPVPVDLVATDAEGTEIKLHRSIAVWEKANSVTLTIPSAKTIKNIKLGSTYVADVNKKDNVWEAP